MEHVSYWHGNAKQQAEYDRLIEFMPSMGQCDNIEIEMIRAVSRIGHDFSNNGFGNNWSGPLEFLNEKLGDDMPAETYAKLAYYSQGRCWPWRGGRGFDMPESFAISTMFRELTEIVIAHAQKAEISGGFTPTNEDMFDYQLPYVHDDDEEESNEDDNWQEVDSN